MSENDFQKKIREITQRANNERKQELAKEKVREREARRIAKAESKIDSAQKEKESTLYTVAIIAKLEYEGVNVPSKEHLAEDLGRTIMKWADQKGF